jgi:hypothetical protein
MMKTQKLPILLTLLILGSASAGAASDKETICHVTGSGNVHALNVSASAVPAHLGHGDSLPGTFYSDADGDGFGDPATGVPACNAPEDYVDNGDDCDDTDPDVSPNATEVPGDGVDNDCNPATPDVVVIACGGGNEANIANFPYQVSIQRLVAGVYVHQCGGALISGTKAVTAASCVSEGALSDYRVGFGSSQLSTMTTVRSLTSRVIHPDYTGTDAGLELNVAKLRFANVPISATVGYITLASASAGDFAGQSVALTGWGDTANTPQIVNDGLQRGTGTVLTNDACSALVNGRPITAGHLCVSGPDLDPCTGDVGGPVRAGNTLAGIQSWPVDLTVPYSSASSVPRVATRISAVRAWIDAN